MAFKRFCALQAGSGQTAQKKKLTATIELWNRIKTLVEDEIAESFV
jgi:hypothetical protein